MSDEKRTDGAERDLFGRDARYGARSDLERKREQRRRSEIPRGYAANPGHGPEGETCGSCAYLHRIGRGKTYLKCLLIKPKWTASSRTDVRARSPACVKWTAPALPESAR